MTLISLSITSALLILMVFILWALLFYLVSDVVSVVSGAPFVPMSQKLVYDILKFGELSDKDIFYDLGCGDGRVLVSAIKDFRVHSAFGYDVAWLPYFWARRRFKKSGFKSVYLRRQNFMTADCSQATFVYAYLLPNLIDRLAAKFAHELKSGTKILAPSFPIDLAKHPEFSLLKSEKIGKITAYLYQKD